MKTVKQILIAVSVVLVALPAAAQKHPDFIVTHEVKTSPVKSQDYTGTCWSYTATSFIESEILRKGGELYDISEMFFVRHVYTQKAKRYVRFHGKSNFSQGGQAHDAIEIIEKYGMVPETVYHGINYKSERHNHSLLEELLKHIAEKFAATENKLSPSWINHYNAVLDGYLGQLPGNFEYKGEQYTGESFAKMVKINAEDYIEITSYSHQPYYKPFVLELPDNWSHDLYYNVPPEELMQIMKYALSNGYSVSWDGDVSGDAFSHKAGKADLLDDQEKLLAGKGAEKFRQILFDNFTATDDHLMHLTGLAKDTEGNTWFQTKNSWASESNNYGGYLYMSENYLMGMTIAIMVHKDALPEGIAKKIIR